jgi:hypothetical protein
MPYHHPYLLKKQKAQRKMVSSAPLLNDWDNFSLNFFSRQCKWHVPKKKNLRRGVYSEVCALPGEGEGEGEGEGGGGGGGMLT